MSVYYVCLLFTSLYIIALCTQASIQYSAVCLFVKLLCVIFCGARISNLYCVYDVFQLLLINGSEALVFGQRPQRPDVL